MSYVKTSWVARVGTALNRFLKTNETATEVELTNDPTGVTTAGTPFTVANMNKIEDGIYDAHVALDNNGLISNTRLDQGVKTTDSPTFANATISGHNVDSELDTLNSRVNQGVKTTDSPTLVGLDISTPVVVTAGSVLLKDDTTFTARSTSYVTVYTYAPLRIVGTLRVFHTLEGDTGSSRTYSLQVAVNGTAVYTGTHPSSSSIASYTDVTLSAGSVLTVSLKSSNASYDATATLAIGISAKPSNLLQCLATYLEDI